MQRNAKLNRNKKYRFKEHAVSVVFHTVIKNVVVQQNFYHRDKYRGKRSCNYIIS
jgi:hypothetical protein